MSVGKVEHRLCRSCAKLRTMAKIAQLSKNVKIVQKCTLQDCNILGDYLDAFQNICVENAAGIA